MRCEQCHYPREPASPHNPGMGEQSKRLPVSARGHLSPQQEFQRNSVVYVTTSGFLWVIWLMSGQPGGLPGVEVVGSTVSASLGVFPAWFMLLGFPGIARRAWEAGLMHVRLTSHV